MRVWYAPPQFPGDENTLPCQGARDSWGGFGAAESGATRRAIRSRGRDARSDLK